MEHNSKSPHVQMLMRGSSVHNHSPAKQLMREKHFRGGMPSSPSHFSEGGKPTRGRFAKGGHCYAEGGETERAYGEKPLTGQLRKGGRARRHHSEGESVEYDSERDEHRKGGRAKRKHHFAGEGVEEMQPKAGAPVGDNSVRQEQKKGGRSKRQGHYWGQDFFGRLPLIGGLANNIANTVGTLDPKQYGGAEYVADTGGKKAADILSTVGNLGANVGLAFLKKGGRAHQKHRSHRAAGGAGKVRKGMMTESGHMIHND